MNTFCWKYYRDWEEQLPPVSILEEKSIHWMFLWCYLCDYVTLMVSYFDYTADRQTIRHPSLWTSRQFPLSPAVPAVPSCPSCASSDGPSCRNPDNHRASHLRKQTASSKACCSCNSNRVKVSLAMMLKSSHWFPCDWLKVSVIKPKSYNMWW